MNTEHEEYTGVDRRFVFGVVLILCLLITFADQLITKFVARVLGG